MRQPGYYWVKYWGQWAVAEWSLNEDGDGDWYMTDLCPDTTTKGISQIIETRLTPPNENP